MLPKSVDIGPLTFHVYGFIVAIAIFIGWYLAKKRAKAHQIPRKIFDDPIILIPLILAIIGARIYHVIDFWQLYKQDLIAIFYLSSGGLGIWGALAGSILGFFFVSKIKKLELLSVLDLAAPSLLLGQAIGRIGNWINQEGFGPPTDKPWGVFIEKTARPIEFINSTHFHPTFFYEAILNLIFFVVLLKLSARLKKGQTFALYLIFYASIRFIVEFWRIDTATIGQFKVAHLISVLVAAGGVYLFALFNKKPSPD